MKNRRRKRFIDSAVQGALVRRIVLHWLIFFVMALLTLSLWRLVRSPDFFGGFSAMMVQGWKETAPTLVIMIVMLPLFVWDTLTFSHRFAGPMYRFHRTIQNLNAGEQFRPIRLRKGDFWTDFADDFNTMVERLKSEQKGHPPAAESEAVACLSGDDDVVSPGI